MIVERGSKHYYALLAVMFIYGTKDGHLFFAGNTPCSPKIKYNNLATIVRERVGNSLRVFKTKLRWLRRFGKNRAQKQSNYEPVVSMRLFFAAAITFH